MQQQISERKHNWLSWQTLQAMQFSSQPAHMFAGPQQTPKDSWHAASCASQEGSLNSDYGTLMMQAGSVLGEAGDICVGLQHLLQPQARCLLLQLVLVMPQVLQQPLCSVYAKAPEQQPTARSLLYVALAHEYGNKSDSRTKSKASRSP